MKVLARYTYRVKPGRMSDFLAKLQQAASPDFHTPTMPLGARLFRSVAPGPDTDHVILDLEYANMEAFGARHDAEQADAAWRGLFAAAPDSPEELVSVELLREIPFTE